MKLTRYLYTGPQSAASLRTGHQNQLLDVQLLPGQPVELPADHEYTAVLLALKHLAVIPVAEPDLPAAQPVTKKGEKPDAR